MTASRHRDKVSTVGKFKTTSAAGIDRIIVHEGEILYVYADPVGLPTVGVGHLLLPSEIRKWPIGHRITKAESRALLQKDLGRFEAAVNDLVKVPLNQNQFDALVSLAFNIGEDNFEKSTVLRRLNRKDYDGAADAFLRWNKARKNGELVVLDGLTKRRNKERALFLTPTGPVPSTDQSKNSRSEAEPEKVSGGGPDSPGSAEPPPLVSTSTSTDKGPGISISGVAKDVADAVTGVIGKAGDIQAGVNKAPFLGQLVTKIISFLAFAAGFMYANWELTLIAFLLFVLAAWYLTVVRKRTLSNGSGTE